VPPHCEDVEVPAAGCVVDRAEVVGQYAIRWDPTRVIGTKQQPRGRYGKPYRPKGIICQIGKIERATYVRGKQTLTRPAPA
jgi:hypothetical protein